MCIHVHTHVPTCPCVCTEVRMCRRIYPYVTLGCSMARECDGAASWQRMAVCADKMTCMICIGGALDSGIPLGDDTVPRGSLMHHQHGEIVAMLSSLGAPARSRCAMC